jgi:hypothetical protein
MRRAIERKTRKSDNTTSPSGSLQISAAKTSSTLAETHRKCHDEEPHQQPSFTDQTLEFLRLRKAGVIPRSSHSFLQDFHQWRDQGCPGGFDEKPAPAPLSPTRLAANRANAQLSTGPTSMQGKANIAHNALKTGLTGRTILLPADDAAAYQAHIRRFVDQYRPTGERECELVQSLADSRWRLNRIPSLETGIYALGKIQFADLFPDQDAPVRAALIEAHTFLVFQKQLNNLGVQEARLRRHFEKDLAELQQSQADRPKNESPKSTAERNAAAEHVPRMPHTGFEFSNAPFDEEPAPDRSDSKGLNGQIPAGSPPADR